MRLVQLAASHLQVEVFPEPGLDSFEGVVLLVVVVGVVSPDVAVLVVG